MSAPFTPPQERLIAGACWAADDWIDQALAEGASVDHIEEHTGMSALHIAVGLNDLALARLLVEKHGAAFFPDRFGRWPTLVAAECGVDEELLDYIVEKEAEFLAREEA